jgi:isoleucyl-tRNA synthetase
MEFAREICKLSHAQRQKNQIKVRQPLANLTIKSNKPSLPSQIEDILKDETNVKNIDWQKSNSDILEVVLDTKLSPQLIEEGEYRDLARSIQVLRKEQNLNLNDKIKIFAPTWPEKYQQELLEKTLAVSIEKSDQLKILKDD